MQHYERVSLQILLANKYELMWKTTNGTTFQRCSGRWVVW